MQYPTIKQANGLLRKYLLPDNIREHCEEVRYNSVVIAGQLRLNGNDVNSELAEVGGLLHDIGWWMYLKERGCRPGKDFHEYGTWKILSDEDFSDFAALAASHPLGGLIFEETVSLGLPEPMDLVPRQLEAKVICIADKIRRGPGIYTLDQKLEDYRTNLRLHERYFGKLPGLLESSIARTEDIWKGLVLLGMNNPPIIRL